MVIGLMISACTDSENSNTVISVLEDTTESHFLAKPNAENIFTQFSFDTDLWHSATFRYGRITSLVNNSRDGVSVPQENALLGNELKRRREVADFNNDVKLLLNKPKDSSIYNHSSIWLPIAEELRFLQKEENTTTTLFVFSDLQENTKWFSVFRVSDIKLLECNIKNLVELFMSKAHGIQPSEAVTVVVVYQPRTIAEDELFQKLKQLYTKISFLLWL